MEFSLKELVGRSAIQCSRPSQWASNACAGKFSFLFYPKQCGRTEGVLTVSVKTRCLIEVGGCGCGIFSCKFPHKMALVKCPCAFRLRTLAQNAVRGIGVRHFS